MKKQHLPFAAAAAAVGALSLLAVGSVANADEFVDDGTVNVNVSITDNTPAGALALSIEGDSTTLAEEGSDAISRSFVGTLPTVTVTDTRAVVPENVGWAVLASTSAFTAGDGQTPITAEHLGWAPHMVTPDPEMQVSEGADVAGVLDGGAGVVDRELLFSTFDSGVRGAASFSADAALKLKVPASTAPGAYSATMTLSLFE